ncbi:toxin VasX [Marinobacter nauticus]|uniref:toxin VasX n=1 Tax=Marinobacter nauticus TaxID=2743 RepID=UPI003514C3EE
MTYCATCPLMTAFLPLRYAIGPMRYEGELLAGLELPDLPDLFPNIDRYTDLQDRNLGLVPRFLRDGWLYVWSEFEGRLIEYSVNDSLLQETTRGGEVVDHRGNVYLSLPSGEPADVAWSENQWSDAHFEMIVNEPGQRSKFMRRIVPGGSPNTQLLDEKTFYALPEVTSIEEFDWTGLTPTIPHWPRLERSTRRFDQRVMGIVDDPWGVTEDLAALVRLAHDNQERLRARFGGEWSLAKTIKDLYETDRQLEAKLPELVDLPKLQRVWRESDESQSHFEDVVAGLLDSWVLWMHTLECANGPETLASSCESLDLAKEDHHTILQEKFGLALLGPSYFSKGAGAIGRLAAVQGEGTRWFWNALLGIRERVSLGDVEKLVSIGDMANDSVEDLSKAATAVVASINSKVSGLVGRAPIPSAVPTQILFNAISPAAAVELRGFPHRISLLGSGFLVSGLARTGQSLAVDSVGAVQSNQWLSEAAKNSGNAAATLSPPDVEARKVPVIRITSANAGQYFKGNPYSLKDALEKAPLRSVLVVLTGLNMVSAISEFFTDSNKDVEGLAKATGSVTGFTAAALSLEHKISELNWNKGLSRSPNPAAYSHGVGAVAAALTAATAAFDIIVFGMQAIESYRSGDFDTSALEVGLMGVSSGQLALSVRAFRAYREARAAALGLQVASSVRGLSRLGGFYTALSLGLTASLIGGLVARHYAQNTPLERWLANTRFGVKPAEWSGNYRDEMEQLYTVIFPIKLRLERVPRLNPHTGIHMQDCWLILELAGQSALNPETIYFSGDELRSGVGYRSLAWVERQLRAVLDTEEREYILQPKRTPVTWSGSDFSLHVGTRVHNAAATATYRRVYHDDDQIFGLQGELIYRPQPGLEMPPVKVDIW